MGSEMDELIKDFVVEAQELLGGLDEKFVLLESSPDDRDLIHEIFRAVHTVKGAAGFLGFQNLVALAHALENVLKKLRDGELSVTAERMDLVLEASAALKSLVAEVASKGKDETDVTALVDRLKKESEQTDTVSTKEEQKTEMAPEHQKQNVAAEGPTEHRIDDFQETTIRVDIERLDSVFNLVGEVVLGRNRLQRLVEQAAQKYESDQDMTSLLEAMEVLNGVISDLQTAVMKTRMQPVKKIFNKFPSMIRNIARTRGKKVKLHISGEHTEVDKSVIEHLADPLVHLLRNAVDHGIETEQERLRAGKSPEGNIYLRAYQEGNSIIIEVEDDGRGLDIEKIKKKAIDKGLTTVDAAESLTDEEVIDFIFAPGFSTMDQATDLSGRGVGMDVVRTNLSKINGSIKVKTFPGKGTLFILSLPLTLAIINVLLVTVGQEVYGVPLASVREVVKVNRHSIKRVDQQDVIVIREEVMPLVNLSHALEVPGANGYSDEFYVVVVSSREDRFGISVDGLMGQEEVVLKAVEGQIVSFTEGSFIAGATIIGDGRVVLIIDTTMLYEYLRKGVLCYAG